MIINPQVLSVAVATLPAVRHLPRDTNEKVRRAIARAALDILAVVEDPPGSNRGDAIDEYLRNAHVPESEIEAGRGYWCAAAVGQWWEDAGLETPKGRASCDRWMSWAKATNRWSPIPVLGAAVLYGRPAKDGKPADAQHIGLIARTYPLVLSVEGNTSVESGYSRNGIAVSDKVVDPKTDPILGYCHPFPAAPAVVPPRAA